MADYNTLFNPYSSLTFKDSFNYNAILSAFFMLSFNKNEEFLFLCYLICLCSFIIFWFLLIGEFCIVQFFYSLITLAWMVSSAFPSKSKLEISKLVFSIPLNRFFKFCRLVMLSNFYLILSAPFCFYFWFSNSNLPPYLPICGDMHYFNRCWPIGDNYYLNFEGFWGGL